MNTKALVAEFVGTFTLIFIGVGAIAANEITNGALGVTGIALAHGLAIACMVSAVAATSGGHLNPAVSIGLWSIGKISAAGMIAYIVAQCLGAVGAAALLRLVIPEAILDAVGAGTPVVNAAINVTATMALMAEIITTFFLMWVIYGTAVDSRAPQMAGLFIGLTVTLDILMAGPISGAAMNPARHLGPALFSGGLGDSWIYWLGPIVGALLGAQVADRTLRST